MQTKPLLTSLRIEPGFSKRFASAVVLMHGGALMLLMPITFPPFVQSVILKWSIVLLIVSSFLHTLKNHIFPRNHPLFGCCLYHDEVSSALNIRLIDGTHATVLPDSYSHPYLAILRVELPNGRISTLVIFPETLDKEVFRRLRVKLKHR